MIVPQKHHCPTSEFKNVERPCRRRQCCTYARLNPFPQSAHLYARSLSSVLKRKHYCFLEGLRCFAYETLDVDLGGPLSHRSYGTRSSDALAGAAGGRRGFSRRRRAVPHVCCRSEWTVGMGG